MTPAADSRLENGALERGAMGAVRRELLDPLHRVLDWMLRQRDERTGALVCAEHGIEHTGKSAGAMVLAIELARHATGDERARLIEVVRSQGERLVARLEREPDSTCFTFRPGRHDAYNCSNSVIDGGACSDALATAVLELGDELSEDQRERFRHAAVLHAQTYLRYAIVDKGVPAQCAWAMTGAAQAYRVSGHEVLQLVCRVGAERLREQQRGDGSFPYHPTEWGAAHPGAADASAYYQSRVTAFTSFALEAAFGEEAGRALDVGFESGIEFLHGLLGPDGIKTGAVEAKPWYWTGSYEVASHPFDIAALSQEWRRTRAPRAASALRASWRAWLHHLGADGKLISHDSRYGGAVDGPIRRAKSYQCPFFWAAHACWIARSLPELEAAFAEPQGPITHESSVRHFRDVDLARIETPDVVAWVRGHRPPGNAFHGSPSGGGLLRVFYRPSGRNLFLADRFGRRPFAAWSGAQGVPSWGRGWRAGSADLRFSGWLMRNRWRTGNTLKEKSAAFALPIQALKGGVLDFGSSVVSSSFDRGSWLEVQDDEVRLAGPFARPDGTPVGGRVERVYRGTPDGVEIIERCVDRSGIRNLWFRAPIHAVMLEEFQDHVRYRFGDLHAES
ncbi:hypothetical protein Poly30_23100 [Planctomycetes bacterium Poly30]|uniref:Uncharacterized protein n=1 Tax=Saltatorellus ferox TaxID=2528018 RepID=A0A518ERX0_9BACT|nr:hypothetical protein Poly30_23100 [Planctomycetes bacterium Poly30]